jgi:hypothetical protein
MRAIGLILFLLLASIAHADAVKPADIYVVDGDTIEALGKRIRLVGFDAPELGGHAHCGLERMLAARATSRLRQMIKSSDDIDRLDRIVGAQASPAPGCNISCFGAPNADWPNRLVSWRRYKGRWTGIVARYRV